jgi:hypothetical protein
VHFSERNRALITVHAAIVSAAEQWHLFDAGPEYVVPEMQGDGAPLSRDATVEQLLGAAFQHLDRQARPEEETNRLSGDVAEKLRGALLSLGDVFDLYEFTNSQGDAITRSEAESYDVHQLVTFFDRAWHEQAGCCGHIPTDREEDLIVERTMRNLRLIQAFGERVTFAPDALLRAIEIQPTAWYREVRHLCRHTIETWFPDAA